MTTARKLIETISEKREQDSLSSNFGHTLWLRPKSFRTSGTIHSYSLYQEVGKQDLRSREKTTHTVQPLKDPSRL